VDACEQQINVAGAATTALLEPAPASPAGVVVVLAPGAGGHMRHRTMNGYAAMLHGCGADVARFDFLYRTAGRKAPDPMPKLQACYRAVVDWVRASRPASRLIIGGHSMGGRVASMLAADGLACDGVLLMAYPLHPPGKPHLLRDAHLPRIHPPVLCFNGTRDAFCTKELMETVVAVLGPNWHQHWVDGADHGFSVLKRSGRTSADVTAEMAVVISAWIEAFAALGPQP
jgi:predicted alpha/beta-hydrolase family hydrolase